MDNKEQHEAIRLLIEREKNYYQILDAISDMVLVKGPNSRILWANKAFRDYYGMSNEQLTNIIDAPFNEPDFTKQYVRDDTYVFTTGKTLDIPEEPVTRHDGKVFLFHTVKSPILNAKGEVIMTIGISRDVTRLKHSIEALQESQEKLKRVTDAVPGAVYQYELQPDGKQKFLFLNEGAEKFFGVSREELFKDFENAWRQVLPEDAGLLRKAILESAQMIKPWLHEFRVKTPDGRIHWIRGQSIPEPLRPEGNVVWNGILIDITETKKMAVELLQSQKMETIGTLAGGIAHDLNNQLTPILGFLDFALGEVLPPHPAAEYLREAKKSAEHAADVIRKLLSFSRPSTQKKVYLGPRRILTEMKSMLTKFLPAMIRVEISCPEKIWGIEGDQTEIESVFMNLAANARDAMPGHGKFVIEASNLKIEGPAAPGHEPGDYVHFSIRDTGMGMSPETVRHIFDPFFTTKRAGEGTGLGLTMVFRIIKDHHGTIEVASKVGEGTTFHIYLPAKTGPMPAQKDSEGEFKREEFLGDHAAVLFVDDEESIRSLGRYFLKQLDYEVLMASDGEEAVKVYQANSCRIKAVILDMTMPKLTGREALKRMLKINPSAKVIISSGYTSKDLPKELVTLGAFEFLPKPYSIVSLARLLKSAMNGNGYSLKKK